MLGPLVLLLVLQPSDAARQELREGNAAYNLGQWEESCRHYARAYRLVEHADLLFNIGQCSRKSGDLGRALDAYKAYLRTSPEDASNREQALRIIAELNTQIAAARLMNSADRKEAPEGAVGTPSPAAPRAPPSKPVYKRWWFWTGVGVVVVGSVAAMALGSSGDGVPDTPLGNQRIFQ